LTTDKVDLYSYLCHFFKDVHSRTQSVIPEIVLPNLKNHNMKLNKVRMFDGFFRLFPEREFYSAAMLKCFNYWDSYYPDAVIRLPGPEAIVFELPLLMGFYETSRQQLATTFLITSNTDSP